MRIMLGSITDGKCNCTAYMINVFILTQTLWPTYGNCFWQYVAPYPTSCSDPDIQKTIDENPGVGHLEIDVWMLCGTNFWGIYVSFGLTGFGAFGYAEKIIAEPSGKRSCDSGWSGFWTEYYTDEFSLCRGSFDPQIMVE